MACIGCDGRPECDSAAHTECWCVTPAQVAANIWLCPYCRLDGTELSEDATEADKHELLADAARHALMDISGPAPGTFSVILSTRRLGAEFTEAKKVLKPFETENGLVLFGHWLMDNNNAGSLDLRLRTAAALGRNDNRLIRHDLSKTKKLKALIRERDRRFGSDRDADTPLTYGMFVRLYRKLKRGKRPRLDSRLLMALILEYAGGVRVGEAAGAGGRHGWEGGAHARTCANRVEVYLDRAKNSTVRETVTISREMESGIDFGADLLEFAAAWGITVSEVTADSTLEAYSYFDTAVVRVSLNGMTPERVEELAADLDEAQQLHDRAIPALAAAARRRREQHDGARYVNVCEGTLDELAPLVPPGTRVPGREQPWWRPCLESCSDLETGARMPGADLLWWLERGYDASINDGPVLLSTIAGSRAAVVSTMPWTPGALAAELRAEFKEVYADLLLNGSEEERRELASIPAGPLGLPKWASHSCRRGGTKRARDTRHLTGASEEDINRHFRWHTAEFKKNMQVSYAGMLSAEQRMAVTRHF
jgi:hypothetical protein